MKLFLFVVGVLLLVTSLLKAFNPATSISWRHQYGLPNWSYIAVLQIELFLGLALVLRAWSNWILRTTAFVFFLFAVISLGLALSGHNTCGCFGPIPVSPWGTFGIDVVIAFSLVGFLRFNSIESNRNCLLRTVVGYLILGPLITGIALSSPEAIAAPGMLYSQNVWILKPEQWEGEYLPIANHILPSKNDLSKGSYVLLLHRHDCSVCEEMRIHYETEQIVPGAKTLLVEVPPFGENKPSVSSFSRHSWLNSDRKWFVKTPVEITLQDGIVTSVTSEFSDDNNVVAWQR